MIESLLVLSISLFTVHLFSQNYQFLTKKMQQQEENVHLHRMMYEEVRALRIHGGPLKIVRSQPISANIQMFKNKRGGIEAVRTKTNNQTFEIEIVSSSIEWLHID